MIRYLADTNILIDHLRGNQRAFDFLKTRMPTVSQVSEAELIEGVKNRQQLKKVDEELGDLEVIPIRPEISEKSIKLMREFFLSHGLKFPDALVAATALEHKLTLVTGNIKHFSFIKGLKVADWS